MTGKFDLRITSHIACETRFVALVPKKLVFHKFVILSVEKNNVIYAGLAAKIPRSKKLPLILFLLRLHSFSLNYKISFGKTPGHRKVP